MTTLVSPPKKRLLKHFNPRPMNCLPRDKSQNGLLHGPESRISILDPKSGEDISNVLTHTWQGEGNLSFYSQSGQTHKNYINKPLNHPSLKLHLKPSVQSNRDS